MSSLPSIAGACLSSRGSSGSTSFLPASVLGDHAAAFDADLTAALGPLGDGGTFTENVSFVYDLARKPV